MKRLKDEITSRAVAIDGFTYRVSRCDRGVCPFLSVSCKSGEMCTYPGSVAKIEDKSVPFPALCPLKFYATYRRV